MSNTTLWLFCGYAKSGKDTAADLFQTILQSQGSVHKTAFAAVVKDEVAERYRLSRDMLDTQEGKAAPLPSGGTVRDLLIHHAESEKRRTQNPAIWAERIAPPPAGTTHWLFTDWRFPEEYTTLRRRFPDARIFTVHVHRPTLTPLTTYTEHMLDVGACHFRLENSGSLLYLGKQLEAVFAAANTP